MNDRSVLIIPGPRTNRVGIPDWPPSRLVVDVKPPKNRFAFV